MGVRAVGVRAVGVRAGDVKTGWYGCEGCGCGGVGCMCLLCSCDGRCDVDVTSSVQPHVVDRADSDCSSSPFLPGASHPGPGVPPEEGCLVV